jgi:glycogen synthase
MNIALISYEYPPSVAIGGIGTYAWQASHMLAEAGNRVSVFAAGKTECVEQPHPRIRVQRVMASSRQLFASALIPHLLTVHRDQKIDVIESPEFGAEGVPAFEAIKEAGRVVKLHTPAFLVGRYGYDHPWLGARLRFWAGGVARGRWRTLRRPLYTRGCDPEYTGILLADEIAAPSHSIGQLLLRDWSLNPDLIHYYPLPYQANTALLTLPVIESVKTVGFLGRMETRKGIVELVQAIPAMLRRAPELRFKFIGPSWPYQGTDMRSWIERRLGSHLASLEFTGPIRPENLAAELAGCDAMVLPSRWESFGFTCCEAMASGRVVVGSAYGGMAEMIEHGISGLLVPPRSPDAICDAVLELVASPSKAASLALGGRDRIVSLLAPNRVLPLQLASYHRAVKKAGLRCPAS